MKISENLLQSLIEQLVTAGMLKSLTRVDLFYDEPKFHKYSATLNYSSKYSDGLKVKDISSSGCSFTSDKEALVKCLSEAMERLNVYCFDKKTAVFSTRNKLGTESMKLSYFYEDDSINFIPFGWIKGHNLTTDKPSLIPAQLAYLNFGHIYKEPFLSPYITTGAASGTDHKTVLLNGILEIVERDAFMTTYLNKIISPGIDLDKITDVKLKSIFAGCLRYNLQPYVFEITNDLEIPTFMTIVVDKTGMGPAITVGLRTCFDKKEAILGSLGEALSIRTWIRGEIYKKKRNDFGIRPSSIRNLKQRGLYWTPLHMIQKLDYLLTSSVKPLKITPFTDNKKQLLKDVINKLKEKGHKIYYADITLDIFKKINYYVYRVMIPSLHPLYLDEQLKTIRKDRLQVVAKFFHLKNYTINPIPHPFL